MNDEYYKRLSESILDQEKSLSQYNFPQSVGVFIKWKGDIYIGSIQEIVPEFSRDIVLLSKSSNKIPSRLVNAIKKLDPERRVLYANDSLDLEGRQHILKITDNILEYMTPEQTKYVIKHVPIVVEL